MKKIVLFSLTFSLLCNSVSFAQKPSYKAYIKPALKGMGALALNLYLL